LHDASGERAAVGAGTGSLGTLLKKNAPHCSWRGLWRDRGGDALTPLGAQGRVPHEPLCVTGYFMLRVAALGIKYPVMHSGSSVTLYITP
jgi:hypothetical protein